MKTAAIRSRPKSATPTERIEKLLTEARREYTRPLLLFGQPKDPACIDLFRLFDEHEADEDDDAPKDRRSGPTLRKMRWEFELASLDSEQPEVRKLAEALGVDLGKDHAPVLAVLDADGKLAATHPLVLGPNQKLDEEALASFLAKHKLPQRDAEKMWPTRSRKRRRRTSESSSSPPRPGADRAASWADSSSRGKAS